MPPPLSPRERLRRGSRAVLRGLRAGHGPVVVRLKGDLDADSVQHTTRLLQSALRGAPKWLEVDLSRVERLNADGILPLFLAARAARAQGVELTFTHAQGQVREVMRRMGLERFLSANASGQ